MSTAQATEHRMLIDGEWGPAASGETFETSSPATGESLGTVPQGDRGDAQRAIAAADRAFEGWSRLTAFERAAKMHAVGDVIERRRDELARTLTLDQGKPLQAEAYGEVDELVEYWRMAAEDGKRLGGELPNSFSPGKRVMLMRRARGPVGIITPWNWPYTMPAELLAPALACGNTVVWTPAPTTALCAIALAECMAEADLPPGVVNLVTGPGPVVGDEIARSPGTRAVAFIGSTPTGRKVASAAAGKAMVIEMGGNGPIVVMDDADVDAAVEATVTACFLCAGQSCTAGERILVHRAVRDEYVEKLARKVTETVLLGDPFDAATTMGPLNNGGVAAKMDEHVADAVARGADVVAGGERAQGFPTDLYWQATVLSDVPADAQAATEETFGPIAPVVSIGSLDEAIELTNASPYGLLAGDLHARHRGRAAVRRLRAHRLGEHQRVLQLLGGASAVRRALGHRQRARPGGRRPCDGRLHRAPDRRPHHLTRVARLRTAEPGQRRALLEHLRHPRYEVLPLDGIVEQVVEHVPTDVKVTVTASPSRGLDATLAVAERLSARGFAVVPHVSARLVRDAEHLEEVVDRLRVAGVREVFVPAGDAPEPGRFAGAAELLTAMTAMGAGFEELGITGYPESHHLISDEETIQAMFDKAPLATYIVSQLCFDPATIVAWIAAVRARGTALPIWVGVPGIVDQAKLVRISMKIGLGESARFLRNHRAWVKRLVTRTFAPDALIAGLAPTYGGPGGERRRLPRLHVQRGRADRALAPAGDRAPGGRLMYLASASRRAARPRGRRRRSGGRRVR